MNSALRSFEEITEADEIGEAMEAVRRVDACGATVKDTIDQTHPAVAAELFWDDYSKGRYSDHELSVSGDRYVTVLNTLLEAYNAAEGTPPLEQEERSGIRVDPFKQGWGTFHEQYAEDSFEAVCDTYDPVTQAVSIGSRLFGGQVAGGIGLVVAAQAGEGGLGAVFLTGMMGAGLYETYRKERAWEGFCAARDTVEAEQAVAALSEEVGDRHVTLRNLPEYDPSAYAVTATELPDTADGDSSQEERMTRLLSFVEEHDELPEGYEDWRTEYDVDE